INSMDYNNFDHPYPYSLYSLEDGTKCVRFVENSCIVIMQNYFKDKNLFFNPVISIKELLPILKNLKANYEFQFRDLINWIEEEYKNEIDLLEKIIKERYIDFYNLTQLFPIGQYVGVKFGETITGAKITDAMFKNNVSGKDYFMIFFEKINSDGLSLIRIQEQQTINFWKGLRKIDSFPIFPISKGDKIYHELVA
ncbi:23057_t:CDS:2, partial [Gigaspora rosea]